VNLRVSMMVEVWHQKIFHHIPPPYPVKSTHRQLPHDLRPTSNIVVLPFEQTTTLLVNLRMVNIACESFDIVVTHTVTE